MFYSPQNLPESNPAALHALNELASPRPAPKAFR
jgi:hypothetical protein